MPMPVRVFDERYFKSFALLLMRNVYTHDKLKTAMRFSIAISWSNNIGQTVRQTSILVRKQIIIDSPKEFGLNAQSTSTLCVQFVRLKH